MKLLLVCLLIMSLGCSNSNAEVPKAGDAKSQTLNRIAQMKKTAESDIEESVEIFIKLAIREGKYSTYAILRDTEAHYKTKINHLENVVAPKLNKLGYNTKIESEDGVTRFHVEW